MMDIAFVSGMSGLICLLLAFIMNLFKKFSQESSSYLLLNIVGGTLLGYYAYTLNSIPFLILEIIWTGFAFYKLLRVLIFHSRINK